MKDKIYVVGHRNPDSDSICSAIAYANLKKVLGYNAIASRLGPLNEETKYILKRFNLENPLLVSDARSQLCDIEIDKAAVIKDTATVKEAWKSLLANERHGLCVINEEGNLSGFITLSNLSMLRLTHFKEIEKMMQSASLEDIAVTIKGQVVLNVSDFSHNGSVVILTLTKSNDYSSRTKGSICVLTDNIERQLEVIKDGASVLIIACGLSVDERVLKLAKEYNCAIISTAKDSMAIAQVINESFPLKHVMSTQLVTLNENEYVDDVLKKMSNTRFRSYPVVSENGDLVGTIGRYHLLNYKKKKFILVDHSAVNQSILNINKAYVEEIIDHHHIGDIETTHPIYYRNQRCGCTATIVAQLYNEHNITPSLEMAGIMLSAIISDTLHFKSATTTKLDIEIAKQLALYAKVDLDSYALEMLGASVALKDSTPIQILNRDLKNYVINGYKIAVGQTNYLDFEDLQSILPEFREILRQECNGEKLDLLIMLFTEVTAKGSMVVYEGELSHIMEDLLETKFDDTSGYDHKIISRKQQLIPRLSELINNI